jgi:hypothetical protein
MEITLRNTTKIVKLNDVPARIWEGETSSGIKCHCYITRIAIDSEDKNANTIFLQELEQCNIPSTEINNIPSRLIL